EAVVTAVRDAGAEPLVHCCAPEVPFDLLDRVGAPGIAVDLALLDAHGHDAVAAAIEAGRLVCLGAVPSTVPATVPATVPTTRTVLERVERFLDAVGLQPTDQLVVTPSCGLAAADPAWARRALELCRSAASELAG